MIDLKGKTVSHYKIIDKIGEGGMGVVYKAQDTKLDRFVAIKFLPPQMAASEENKARFSREAKSAAALSHPNILSVYEIDEENDSLFIVMEFVDGDTLKSHISKITSGTGVKVDQAIEWIEQISQGLKSAHDMDIIHRDIKTENVMINKDNRLKIMDFGLAKLKSSVGVTKTKSSLGTLSYMAPEQVHGDPADHRSDIWALGVVFYEILTGELPFKSEHEAALLYLISSEQPLSPNLLNKKVPHQLDSLINKMLEKDREKRFQNMDEFLNTFNSVKEDIKNASAAPKTKAIVVLPFDNISPDADSDYFADGLTEELIANLSRLKDIRLVPRTTSMRYKGTNKDIKTIGRELGTRYILAGSVRKFQENLRITVELIDVDTDAQLWADTYKGKLADVFDIQENVSKQIVDMLMVKLTPTEKIVLTKRSTVNAEAFDFYLRGRDSLYRRTTKSMLHAIQLFEKAISLDPRYADAYAGIGEAYSALYLDSQRNPDWLDKAIENGLKALMYDSGLSEAYAALGLAYYNKRSFEEAVASSQKAIELDPNNYIAYWILARIYIATNKESEAESLCMKVIELNPDFYSIYGDLQIVYGRTGNTEKYNSVIKSGIETYRRHLTQHPDDARCYMYLATDLAQQGHKEEALLQAKKALELNPDDPLMLYNACCFYAQLGEKDNALKSIVAAIDVGYANIEWLENDVDLDSIRNEPQFQNYVQQLKKKELNNSK
ncbi:MAG TPA: protein kinase [Ignavibacteriaceae bacterium]|nr:protein kinase [Ignavibacteriaceae bacterium]